jgi:TolA-binding protein
MITAKGRIRAIAVALALGAAGLGAMPAAAQSGDADARLKAVEAQVRALQRKVFPDGAGKTFEPEVTPAGANATGPIPVPASSAITDMLGRLDSIEAQLARLTSQTEENANAVTQLTARVEALEAARAPAPVTVDAAPAALVEPAPAPAKASPPKAAPAQKPAAPSADRIAAVQQIAKPQTDDPGDDEYTYGFRLWDAGFYPEAEQQLRLFIDKYPNHARASYGRNLLGRAYLADGKPNDAASWFLKNYQVDKDGARAPDSLLYLAETMMVLKDTKKACIALAEFAKVYTPLATGRLADQYEGDRGKVTCN